MSEENSAGGTDEEVVENKASGEKEANDFVKRSAYEEVSKDMHKYKAALKEEAAEKARLAAELKAREENEMLEQKRFEDLYAREKEERAKLEQTLQQNQEHLVNSVKKTALLRELGDIDPKYLKHANLEGIEVRDDGTISSESVLSVANKFREENPALVPGTSSATITDSAPASQTLSAQEKVDIDNMSPDQLRALIASAPMSSKKNINNN